MATPYSLICFSSRADHSPLPFLSSFLSLKISPFVASDLHSLLRRGYMSFGADAIATFLLPCESNFVARSLEYIHRDPYPHGSCSAVVHLRKAPCFYPGSRVSLPTRPIFSALDHLRSPLLVSDVVSRSCVDRTALAGHVKAL
jgi:hypothetical protein